MKPVHILLVEDNEGDILLITEALKDGRILNTISIAKDGEQAVDFLEKRGDFQNKHLPDLIILDINLPKINGHEVLEHIKKTEYLKQIPVIMLTTSSSEKDIVESYKHHANCYITKPVEVDEFLNAVTQIEQFWIQLIKLPTNVTES
ncbi:MAG: response regulator [Balneolaceae bacterium]